MRIAVDTRHLQMMMSTGGAQVLHHGLRALTRFDGDNEYLRFHDGLGRFARNHPRLAGMTALWADCVSKNLYIPAWARRRKVDGYLLYLPPAIWLDRSIPQLCYILDVGTPGEARNLEEWIYNDVFIKYTCRHATRILTISNFSADGIVERFGTARDRIRVIYPCTDLETFRPPAAPPPEWMTARGLKPGYLLGVLSRVAERKNPAAYLEVVRRLPPDVRREHPLVIAGVPRGTDELRPFLKKPGSDLADGSIVFLGKVTDDQLVALYQHAAALLFPSRFEGFGLPIIEAAACGADVIASSIPVFREVAPPGAFLLGPDDYDGMARAFLGILAKPEDKPGRMMSGLKRVREFSYETYAETMRAILKETIQ